MENSGFLYGRYGRAVSWGILSFFTVCAALFLHAVNIPASPLLGAIVSGIITAVLFKTNIKVPSLMFHGAQSILGCMIANIFTLSVLYSIFDNLLLVLFCVFSMLIFSFILGRILSSHGILPGTTAVWGSWPGGAATMVVLSGSYGADMRLVAFMQYMRVVIVALTASAVTMFFGLDSSAAKPDFLQYMFPAFNVKDLFITLAFAASCTAIARLLKFSAGPILLTMITGTLLMNTGLIKIELPQWLLTVTYVLIGWSIGLRFTRAIVAHAFKALPKVLLSIIILIVLCVAVAAVLVFAAGIDPLTAYLASSPGGADSIAIIAASSDVDTAFVMSVQIMRFAVVLMIGPSIAKLIGKRAAGRKQ